MWELMSMGSSKIVFGVQSEVRGRQVTQGSERVTEGLRLCAVPRTVLALPDEESAVIVAGAILL